jgi:hypothetical protein
MNSGGVEVGRLELLQACRSKQLAVYYTPQPHAMLLSKASYERKYWTNRGTSTMPTKCLH